MRASEAKAICTAAEYDLIRDAAPPRITQHTPSQLRGLVARARRLRDKYRDLANRQRREARGKAAPRGANPSGRNENTIKKLKLFEQALTRFQAKLDKLAVGSKAEKKAAGAKKAGVKKSGARGSKKPAASADSSASPSVAASPASSDLVTSDTAPSAPRRVGTSRRAGAVLGVVGMAPTPVKTVDTAGVVAARETALKTKSKLTQPSRRKNVLAGTANARIRGHAIGSFARAQAKRDAKNAKDG